MVYFIDFDSPLQKLQCLSLSKTLVSALGQRWCFCPWDMRGRGIPSYNLIPWVQWNQRFLDLSHNFHSMASWNSLPRAFRDPANNWFRVLKPKWISGIHICEFEKVYLGMRKVINLPIGSFYPFYFFWPPIAKIAMCLTEQNPTFRSRPKMMFSPMVHKGRGHPKI